jgi:nicotinamide-nucleotide amidase
MVSVSPMSRFSDRVHPMKACIIAVGSELLTPYRVDTNSLTITERVNAAGFDVRLKAIVGDDVDELADVFGRALGWADLIVLTGGLGPTEDDITRTAVARVLGLPLHLDADVLARIRERFARRGLRMADINERQALVPRGATWLANPNGTAPGLWLERDRTAIVLLPGPPREMVPMLDGVIRDRLEARSGGMRVYRRVIKLTGRGESDVDASAQPVYGRWVDGPHPVSTTILSVPGQIELHLSATAADADEAEAVLGPAVRELQDTLGDLVFSVDGRQIEEIVGDLLRERGLRVAAAESCTGGLLTSRLTNVPGSSDYVERAVVCYSNRSKIDWLGVSESLIREHGAVSDEVARAMAEGICSRAGTEVGMAITGIAGPGGGTPQKPVGTVSIAVKANDAVRVRTFVFPGGRELVKAQSATAALNMLRLMLRSTHSGQG